MGCCPGNESDDFFIQSKIVEDKLTHLSNLKKRIIEANYANERDADESGSAYLALIKEIKDNDIKKLAQILETQQNEKDKYLKDELVNKKKCFGDLELKFSLENNLNDDEKRIAVSNQEKKKKQFTNNLA